MPAAHYQYTTGKRGNVPGFFPKLFLVFWGSGITYIPVTFSALFGVQHIMTTTGRGLSISGAPKIPPIFTPLALLRVGFLFDGFCGGFSLRSLRLNLFPVPLYRVLLVSFSPLYRALQTIARTWPALKGFAAIRTSTDPFICHTQYPVEPKPPLPRSVGVSSSTCSGVT